MSVSGPKGNRNLAISSRVSGLNLETLSSGAWGDDVRISGSVHGSVTLSAADSNPWVAELDMSLKKLRTNHPSGGIFAQSPITGDLQGSVRIHRGQMRITAMTLRAETFYADIRGAVFPGNPLSSSRLRLTADVRSTSETAGTPKREPLPTGRKPRDLPKSRASFKIRGTVGQPSIQMILPVD